MTPITRRILAIVAVVGVVAATVIGGINYRFTAFNKADLALKTGDYATTLRVLKPWAHLGDSNAQYTLGLLYALGWGVVKDDSEAIKWFERAQMWSSPGIQPAAPAKYDIGILYAEGRGVMKDQEEARKWFERSAKGGFEKASEQLTRMPTK